MENTVTELNDENFKSTLMAASLAFLDIYAAWCGPCRLFAPIFSEVAAKYPNIAFYKIDGDLHAAARDGLAIDNLPYIAVFRNGQFVEGVSISAAEGLENLIRKVQATEA